MTIYKVKIPLNTKKCITLPAFNASDRVVTKTRAGTGLGRDVPSRWLKYGTRRDVQAWDKQVWKARFPHESWVQILIPISWRPDSTAALPRKAKHTVCCIAINRLMFPYNAQQSCIRLIKYMVCVDVPRYTAWTKPWYSCVHTCFVTATQIRKIIHCTDDWFANDIEPSAFWRV